MIKRNGFLAGSTAALVAAVLGGAVLPSGSPAVHAAPVAASRAAVRQVGYAGQLAESVTGQFPVVIRLYSGNDAVLHEETVTADIKRGKFQAAVGGQTDLTGVLRDAQTMRVFFQGNLVDTVAVVRATADDAIAHPEQFMGRRVLIVPPDVSAPVVSPRALAGTCSLTTAFASVSAGFFGLNPPACGSGVMVSAGFLPFSSDASLVGIFPAGFPTDWSIQFRLPTATSVEVFGVCCL